ncbi:MAG: hypothetical protein ACOX7O_10690 [Oscillospiraceae bacterium]|nr:hypothetical protein [Syntrophomonadaceae bacterium]
MDTTYWAQLLSGEKETFSFGYSSNEPSVTASPPWNTKKFTNLQSALNVYEISHRIAPKYIPEVYESGGISHYIMTNMDSYAAAWTNGSLEGGIFGPKTKNDLLKMIDSIYKE